MKAFSLTKLLMKNLHGGGETQLNQCVIEIVSDAVFPRFLNESSRSKFLFNDDFSFVGIPLNLSFWLSQKKDCL